MVSSLLSAAYLLPIVARGFFLPPPDADPDAKIKISEAPMACVVPLCVTAALCVVLFFGADWVKSTFDLMEFRPPSTAALHGVALDGQ